METALPNRPAPMNGTRFSPMYRAPAQSRAVIVQTIRAGRQSRYHLGARLGDGPLLLPEACNLDQAARLEEIPGDVPATDPWPPGAACRRCFRPWFQG